MGRYKVVIGDDFEIEAIEIEGIDEVSDLSEIAERHFNQQIQERLTFVIFGAIAVALLIAALIGVYDGSFNEVGAVWSAAALPLGYVLKAYFDKPPSSSVRPNAPRRKVK